MIKIISNINIRIYWSVVMLFVVLTFVGCNGNSGEMNNEVNDGTRFARYSVSLTKDSGIIDLMFFMTKGDLNLWNIENIESAYIKIGDVITEVTVKSLTISDKIIYNRYYSGQITVEGDFEESSGDAYLSIIFSQNGQRMEYAIGNYGVVDSSQTTYDDIGNAISCGIVMSDEDDNENVNNYGIILHCEILKDITINNIGLGLEGLGLVVDDCIVYTPEEYHNEIYTLIDENRLDEVIDNVYEKRYVKKIKEEAGMELSAGEYYIYFPLETLGEGVPEFCQGVICIDYTNSDQNSHHYVTSSTLYFSEFWKSEASLNEMFRVDE